MFKKVTLFILSFVLITCPPVVLTSIPLFSPVHLATPTALQQPPLVIPLAKGEPLTLFFSLRKQGDSVKALRPEINKEALIQSLNIRFEHHTETLADRGIPLYLIRDAILDLTESQLMEFSAVVQHTHKAPSQRSWLLGFNNHPFPKRWPTLLNDSEKIIHEKDITEALLQEHLSLLYHEPTMGFSRELLDRLSGASLEAYLFYQALFPHLGEKGTLEALRILFGPLLCEMFFQTVGSYLASYPVAEPVRSRSDEERALRIVEFSMRFMYRLRHLFRAKIPEASKKFMKVLRDNQDLENPSDFIVLFSFLNHLVQSPEPIFFRPLDPSFTYKHGMLLLDIAAYILYEAYLAGLIQEEAVLENIAKYMEPVAQLTNPFYYKRPPLRETITSIDVLYNDKIGGGIGDLKQSITVSQILKKRYPQARVRLRLVGFHEDLIRKFYPEWDGAKGRTTFDGIQFVRYDDIDESADITIENFSPLFCSDINNHSPVQILIDEYGYDYPLYLNPRYCPAIAGRVVTGPGEGLFLSPEAVRLKAWFEALSPQDKKEQKMQFARKIIQTHSELKKTPYTDTDIINLANIPWSLLYCGDRVSELEDNILFQALSEFSKETPVILFDFNSWEVSKNIVLRGLNQISSGVNVIPMDLLPHEDFLKLMLFCDLPFMITGDGSLTEAIQLQKPFMYEVLKHKFSLRNDVPFYFLTPSTIEAKAQRDPQRMSALEAENQQQKEKLIRYLQEHYPHFPLMGLSVLDVEEKIVQEIERSWEKHRQRLNDPVFRFLYDRLEVRILNVIIPGTLDLFLPHPEATQAVSSNTIQVTPRKAPFQDPRKTLEICL